MIRLAIVGVGWAGSRHVEAIRELGGRVEAACLVDADAAFLKEKAAEFGIGKTYADFEAALRDPDVDAVDICTPHPLHCPMAIRAAEAGKHVLVEKPMAMSVEEATRMMDAADRAGVKLYVAENLPYTPMSRFLREVVQSGRYVGEVVTASFAAGFRAPNFGYPGRRGWLTKPDQGGTGTWMLQGIHSVAQMRFVFGEVETVYVREHHAASFGRLDIEGTMTGMLGLEKGFQVAVVQSCEVALKGVLGGYAIHGDRGSVRAMAERCEVFPAEGEPFEVAYPASGLSDYALELAAFADYISDGVEGPTSAASERRSLSVVQAGYESAQSGQPVRLRARFGDL